MSNARSTLRLPAGDWRTVLECLCAHFPAIPHATWLARMQAGRVLDEDGLPLASDAAYHRGATVHYFREVDAEAPMPGGERILHADEHLVVADKPHFLPVMPAGRFVRETLLARLQARLGNTDLVPLHRIDRGTAGLVLFSASRASRAAYQALFPARRITKVYEAIAPALPGLTFPLERTSRIVAGEPFFRMCEAAGAPNATTLIDVLQRADGSHWRYRLQPDTGRKHQLRVHMAALGAPILGDPFYPVLQEEGEDALEAPLQLLARSLSFVDPLSGEPREFTSERTLDILTPRPATSAQRDTHPRSR